jgi:hypothetical protein
MYNTKKLKYFGGRKNGLDRLRSLIAEGHIHCVPPANTKLRPARRVELWGGGANPIIANLFLN